MCHLRRISWEKGLPWVLTFLYDCEPKILLKVSVQAPSFSPPLNPCLTLLHPPKLCSPLYAHPITPLLIVRPVFQNTWHLSNCIPCSIAHHLSSLLSCGLFYWKVGTTLTGILLGLMLLRMTRAWGKHLVHIYYVCWHICRYAAFS